MIKLDGKEHPNYQTEVHQQQESMDEQQVHDPQRLEARRQGLDLPSKEQVQALLAKKEGRSSAHKPSTAYDPLQLAMENNPGLTYEEAERWRPRSASKEARCYLSG